MPITSCYLSALYCQKSRISWCTKDNQTARLISSSFYPNAVRMQCKTLNELAKGNRYTWGYFDKRTNTYTALGVC